MSVYKDVVYKERKCNLPFPNDSYSLLLANASSVKPIDFDFSLGFKLDPCS